MMSLSYAEQHARHTKAQEETGFWGREGAGCLFLSRTTGRILFAHRSLGVDQPQTWGTWGGAIDENETPLCAVKREIIEEAGYEIESELHALLVFTSGSFRYHNFLAIVEDEFDPILDWETESFMWTELENAPNPMHPGLKVLMNDEESLLIIKNHMSSSSYKI
jgi:8-oxo-dGTP pyrophosphatase MutT (NUDIX family)